MAHQRRLPPLEVDPRGRAGVPAVPPAQLVRRASRPQLLRAQRRQAAEELAVPVRGRVRADEPDQVDNQSELMDLAEPVNTIHAEAQEAVQMEIEQVQNNLFPPGNVTIRSVSKNEMIALNAMSTADRKRAIDRLNLNDVDRTRLVNSLWRLRNPERVRQNSRRSYQNRRLQAQA